MDEENNLSADKSKNGRNNLFTDFSEIIEFFPTGFFVLDQEENLKDINKAGESLIGKKREDIINKKFSEFIVESDKKQFKTVLEKASKTLLSQKNELKIKTAGNNYLPSLIIVKYNLDSDSAKGFYFLTIIDFTQQKVKEELIKDSEARFENMANTAPVMIWIADVEGLFSFVNKVWLEYSGKKLGDQLGMNWLKDVHPNDLENLLKTYKDAFRSRNPFTFEFRLKNRNDKYEWIMIKGTPRLSRENIFMGFIGSCTNINSQKEFEEKIRRVNSELIDINASKDKFFSIISHDLRSPLGGLMQILEILEESHDSMEDEEKITIIKEAASTSKLVFALMENLLEWSRIQAGKIPYEPERIEIFPIINELESLYNQNLKSKQITFKNNIEAGLTAFADIKMTNTILRNLISNAIKFTNSKGFIYISSEENENFVNIMVKDTGVGIDEENSDKIFKPDSGYSTNGTAHEKGTGLGLVLCKELVEKQGGKIHVESKKGDGSTFTFSLPRKNKLFL
ncbi:MAG: PAS domain-containing sensor histidine kinase [Ignavibacteriaceae bacterium]